MTERDSAGKLRLAGASGAVAATLYKGIYRFDQIDVVRGGYYDSGEPGPNGPVTLLEGLMHLASPVVATNVLVRSNATLRPAGSATGGHFPGERHDDGRSRRQDRRRRPPPQPCQPSPGPTAPAAATAAPATAKTGTYLGATFDSVYRPQHAGRHAATATTATGGRTAAAG